MMEIINSDELVIGGGLSGLMYGLTAVTEGRSVIISEAHHKVGGYATNFYRNKRQFLFDCSQHKVTGLNKNLGNLWNALDRLGLQSLINEFHFYNELTTVVYKDRFITIPSDPEHIKEALISYFPEEKEGVEKLFADILTYGHQHYMFSRMLLNEYTLNKDLLRDSRLLSKFTTREYYKTLFKKEDIIEVLSSIAIYLGAISHEVNAFYFLHFLYATFYGGQSYIKGTGQRISDILLKEFLDRGGQILKKNPVYEIENKGDYIQAKTKKKLIEAQRIIATCSPNDVVNMLGKEKVEDAFLKILDSFQVGWGHFCVYAVTSVPPEELGLVCSEYLLVSDKGDYFTDHDFERDLYYDILTLSVTNYHKIDSSGGYIIQFIILDHGDKWFNLSEEEYNDRKERVQQKIIKRVYQTFPKLENKLIYIESSTPKTNYRFTLSTQGSAFGYKVLPKTHLGMLNNFPNDKINLVSSWVSGPGYESAMCFGFTQALLLNDKKFLKHV
ncbi:NAD(P)/FAD-dependent oxidoreductase [Chryseobacterium nematophagum]|uniref:NAD(P)/FAD-dependent oxidoreductase n=1 Tax=Chryseobacterium nematophagum TaxID=2305228 RepID=A0A3M7TKH9_9FLAO|nr:FAD-dependent oxidoreductase [Chryseobacterium nematophagum]RNA63526.1 NAD(P)/FAD-dependent oxidoreductase [Chryseobacterium nematophagum]